MRPSRTRRSAGIRNRLFCLRDPGGRRALSLPLRSHRLLPVVRLGLQAPGVQPDPANRLLRPPPAAPEARSLRLRPADRSLPRPPEVRSALPCLACLLVQPVPPVRSVRSVPVLAAAVVGIVRCRGNRTRCRVQVVRWGLFRPEARSPRSRPAVPLLRCSRLVPEVRPGPAVRLLRLRPRDLAVRLLPLRPGDLAVRPVPLLRCSRLVPEARWVRSVRHHLCGSIP
jgi:hypothetical protein